MLEIVPWKQKQLVLVFFITPPDKNKKIKWTWSMESKSRLKDDLPLSWCPFIFVLQEMPGKIDAEVLLGRVPSNVKANPLLADGIDPTCGIKILCPPLFFIVESHGLKVCDCKLWVLNPSVTFSIPLFFTFLQYFLLKWRHKNVSFMFDIEEKRCYIPHQCHIPSWRRTWMSWTSNPQRLCTHLCSIVV